MLALRTTLSEMVSTLFLGIGEEMVAWLPRVSDSKNVSCLQCPESRELVNFTLMSSCVQCPLLLCESVAP